MKRMHILASAALLGMSLVGAAPAMANDVHHDQHREQFCYWDDNKEAIVCEWRWED